ncbi:hypothetical protein ACOMHN_028884 [Nucella lapillus]
MSQLSCSAHVMCYCPLSLLATRPLPSLSADYDKATESKVIVLPPSPVITSHTPVSASASVSQECSPSDVTPLDPVPLLNHETKNIAGEPYVLPQSIDRSLSTPMSIVPLLGTSLNT